MSVWKITKSELIWDNQLDHVDKLYTTINSTTIVAWESAGMILCNRYYWFSTVRINLEIKPPPYAITTMFQSLNLTKVPSIKTLGPVDSNEGGKIQFDNRFKRIWREK